MHDINNDHIKMLVMDQELRGLKEEVSHLEIQLNDTRQERETLKINFDQLMDNHNKLM
jgi:hypothetical protein